MHHPINGWASDRPEPSVALIHTTHVQHQTGLADTLLVRTIGCVSFTRALRPQTPNRVHMRGRAHAGTHGRTRTNRRSRAPTCASQQSLFKRVVSPEGWHQLETCISMIFAQEGPACHGVLSVGVHALPPPLPGWIWGLVTRAAVSHAGSASAKRIVGSTLRNHKGNGWAQLTQGETTIQHVGQSVVAPTALSLWGHRKCSVECNDLPPDGSIPLLQWPLSPSHRLSHSMASPCAMNSGKPTNQTSNRRRDGKIRHTVSELQRIHNI